VIGKKAEMTGTAFVVLDKCNRHHWVKRLRTTFGKRPGKSCPDFLAALTAADDPKQS
jgi:hypothetical protein